MSKHSCLSVIDGYR